MASLSKIGVCRRDSPCPVLTPPKQVSQVNRDVGPARFCGALLAPPGEAEPVSTLPAAAADLVLSSAFLFSGPWENISQLLGLEVDGGNEWATVQMRVCNSGRSGRFYVVCILSQ